MSQINRQSVQLMGVLGNTCLKLPAKWRILYLGNFNKRRIDGIPVFRHYAVVPAKAGIQSVVSLITYDGLGSGLRRNDDRIKYFNKCSSV